MNNRDAITSFASKRPLALGVYGYGSGVFKQANYNNGVTPLTDVIFIVDDLREWHDNNISLNPHDYSFMGRMHFNQKNINKVKGVNKITYFSEIKDCGYKFKYGVIEISDFVNGLETWENLFVAGRFHKPVLEIKATDNIKNAIEYNRKCALMVACLFCDKVVTSHDIFYNLCNLSYMGDARMSFAENPHKVENIVDGSQSLLEKIYPFDVEFITKKGDYYEIDYEKIIENLAYLPRELVEYLDVLETDYSDLELLRINIGTFILKKNRVESTAQILEGVRTNGIVRSMPYVLAKLKKHFSK